MNLRHATGGLVAALVLGLAATSLAPAPASATERSIRCDGAEVVLKVRKAEGRYRVKLAIDGDPGAVFRLVMRQDNMIFFNASRRLDAEGEFSFAGYRRLRNGDVFRVRTNDIGTKDPCRAQISFV